ncbi:MAG: hypothetical protein E7317_02835 [Clostridiales bacterium]|nr:hypothetical protein [Clostridiales bacterium]
MDDRFTDSMTIGPDGVYRWYYDMDMYENKSMLYTLLKVNALIFAGISVLGSAFLAFMEGGFRGMPAGVLAIGLIMGAAMSLLYIVGFYIAAGIKGGNHRIHFAMRDDGIELVWPEKLVGAMDAGMKAASIAGAAMGGGRRGRRPTLTEVSNAPFAAVTRVKVYPQWNMIDLSMPGGKFQVYAKAEDLKQAEEYILARVPARARGE